MFAAHLGSASGLSAASGRRRWAARRASHMLPAAGKDRSGFFSDADPNAEVYPVKSGLDNDITKRGGRWQSDFIWNTNWQDKLEYEESLRKQAAEGEGSGSESEDGPGKLRLASKVDLNSMDVDLTQQLLARRKSPAEASSSAPSAPRRRSSGAAGGAAGNPANVRRPARSGSNPPTRLEQKGWERGGKYARKVVAVAPTNAVDEAEQAAILEAERQRYDELKSELQAWAAGLTAACFAITFAFYGRDVAASYGVGAVGGLIYLRLLNKSIDSVGVGLGGALGQPRLLIPVILALGYNRYNTMVADETGLTLQLLPMLIGFFTYKGAVIAKQSLVLFGELAGAGNNPNSSGSEGGAAAGGAGEGSGSGAAAAVDVTSVDRAFNKRVMSG